MTMNQAEMDRKKHQRIIDNGIVLDSQLFDCLTLDSILAIQLQLQSLREQKGKEYVVVSVGQPYGGPKRLLALPREDVDAAHRAYRMGLRGISPEIGRVYDLNAERELLKHLPTVNLSCYPPEFLSFLDSLRK